MSEVVSIERGRRKKGQTFFDTYSDNARREWFIEQSSFWAGALISFGLPQFIFGIYGGVIPVVAFAVSLAVGIAWGLALYYLLPIEFLSIVGRGPATQNPPSEDNVLKAAA